MQRAYQVLAELPLVQTDKMVAIGFCVGGLCVLDLARSGAGVAGVVSFHGSLHQIPLLNPSQSLRIYWYYMVIMIQWCLLWLCNNFVMK